MSKKRRARIRLTEEEKERLNPELLPIYDQVPVYKAAFDLLVFIYRSTEHMRHDYRNTLVEDMKYSVKDLLRRIYRAHKMTPRAPLIADAMESCLDAKIDYRVMDKLCLLRDWHYPEYIGGLSSISKQLMAWYHHEEKKEKEQKKKEENKAPPGGT